MCMCYIPMPNKHTQIKDGCLKSIAQKVRFVNPLLNISQYNSICCIGKYIEVILMQLACKLCIHEKNCFFSIFGLFCWSILSAKFEWANRVFFYFHVPWLPLCGE